MIKIIELKKAQPCDYNYKVKIIKQIIIMSSIHSYDCSLWEYKHCQ